ncbi:hypothetical protein ONZ51_g5967 [Trametes cubensis]|uniref:Fungal-type protein kinase domain-containing protein n=1 Tax=Trametes cubensis TaxID=1111947 RepID=A0AAD7XAF7_9APHY|nr:hypothetical protein ONZ51_g5967 [Trametes cubensis]
MYPSAHGNRDLKHDPDEVDSFFARDAASIAHCVAIGPWLETVPRLNADALAALRDVDAKHEAELYVSLTALLNRIHVKAESMSDFRQDDALDVRLVDLRQLVGNFHPGIVWAENTDDVHWSSVLLTLTAELQDPAKRAQRDKNDFSDANASDEAVSSGATSLVDDRPSYAHLSMKRRHSDTSHDGELPSKRLKKFQVECTELREGTRALNGTLLVMQHSRGTRLSSLAITVNGTVVTFWYIDPCGIVVSDGALCLVNNFSDFVAAMVALERLDAPGWGVIPRLILPERTTINDLMFSGTLQGCAFDVPRDFAADCMHHRVTFGECTYSRSGLVGRRTVVYAAQAHPPFAGQKPAERTWG